MISLSIKNTDYVLKHNQYFLQQVTVYFLFSFISLAYLNTIKKWVCKYKLNIYVCVP